jgi:hypothetical protein
MSEIQFVLPLMYRWGMSATSPVHVLRASLAADRDGLRAAVERVPAALRERKPAPERWSVAEVLEHLGIVESRTVAALTPLISNAPANGAVTAPTAATPIDRVVMRDRTQRVTAPDPICPTGTVNADAAWAALERSRSALLALLDTAEGRDLTTITRTHPRLGPIDGYQWIAAVGGHEERHSLQILEIADELASEAT